jgi:hypothetical protein
LLLEGQAPAVTDQMWPTAAARDGNSRGPDAADSSRMDRKRERGSVNAAGLPSDDLSSAASIQADVLWRTPATTDVGTPLEKLHTKEGEAPELGRRMYRTGPGGEEINQTQSLELQANLAALNWMTPTIADSKGVGYQYDGHTKGQDGITQTLTGQAEGILPGGEREQTAWDQTPSPNTPNSSNCSPPSDPSSRTPDSSAWATPTSRDYKDRAAATDQPGTPTNGMLGRQAPRVMEDSMWATPTAKLAEDSQTHRSGDRSGELLLTGQAQSGKWNPPETPPGAIDPAAMWPTPDAGLYGNQPQANATQWNGNNTLVSLSEKGFPSPLQDQETSTPGGGSSPSGRTSPPPSPEKRRRLNPAFVEWLMNMPEGWTTVSIGSGRLEMPCSESRQQPHCCSCYRCTARRKFREWESRTLRQLESLVRNQNAATEQRQWPTPKAQEDGCSLEATRKRKSRAKKKHAEGGYAKGCGAPSMNSLNFAAQEFEEKIAEPAIPQDQAWMTPDTKPDRPNLGSNKKGIASIQGQAEHVAAETSPPTTT